MNQITTQPETKTPTEIYLEGYMLAGSEFSPEQRQRIIRDETTAQIEARCHEAGCRAVSHAASPDKEKLAKLEEQLETVRQLREHERKVWQAQEKENIKLKELAKTLFAGVWKGKLWRSKGMPEDEFEIIRKALNAGIEAGLRGNKMNDSPWSAGIGLCCKCDLPKGQCKCNEFPKQCPNTNCIDGRVPIGGGFGWGHTNQCPICKGKGTI